MKSFIIENNSRQNWNNSLKKLIDSTGAKSLNLIKIRDIFYEVVCACSPGIDLFKQGQHFKKDEIMVGIASESDTPVKLKEEQISKLEGFKELNTGIKLYLSYPVFWPDGKLFGHLCIYDTENNEMIDHYENEFKEFCMLVESDLKAMINRSEQTNIKINTEETGQLIEKFAPEEFISLWDAAKSILNNREFEVSARIIFDEACRMTGATSGYVALLNESGEENDVLFLEAGGKECTVDPELPMPIRGLRAESYKSGKTVYNNDFMNSEWIKFMPAGHVVMKNVMFSPLNIEGKTVGIMGLANKEEDFTEYDANIATAFGELAAISLNNARLLDELEVTNQKLENFNNIMVNREMRIIEIKNEVNELSKELGRPAVYKNIENTTD